MPKIFKKIKNKLKKLLLEEDANDKRINNSEYSSRDEMNEIDELEELNTLFKGQRRRIREKRLHNRINMPNYSKKDEAAMFEELFDTSDVNEDKPDIEIS